ncbi:BMP family ABC transporter substrate-binding protein [Niallia sp. 03133]|uniref:BMP family ABC transporter substrate-binding protein n=1 Tax=Niallia sp. 03133 TaxID=3458060 RepID=UPI0040449007
MQKIKKMILTSFLLFSFLLVSCGQAEHTGTIKKVGLLVEGTVRDQMMGTNSYKGLLTIQSKYNVDIYYKEEINSEAITERAVAEFESKGVNLIFGNGQLYSEYFKKLADKYPSIYFVSFNGNATNNNTTSVILEGYPIGFFAGMVAGHMTDTNTVASIGERKSQSEIEGFHDGVKYENENIKVITAFVHNNDNSEEALQLLEKQIKQKADIVYPAGNSYNIAGIEKLKEKGLYAIGYTSEQADLGTYTVLTSTIQQIPEIYAKIAKDFNEGKLQSGNVQVGMKDEFISLGELSPKIDEKFKDRIKKEINHYKKTGELPEKKNK